MRQARDARPGAAPYPLDGSEGGGPVLRRLLDEVATALHEARLVIDAAATDTADTDVTPDRISEPARRWFEENFYIIEAQIRECRQELGDEDAPLRLPLTGRENGMDACPRIYLLMRDIVGDLIAPVTVAQLREGLSGYQQGGPEQCLALRELGAVPLMVRLAVLARLAPVARSVADRIGASPAPVPETMPETVPETWTKTGGDGKALAARQQQALAQARSAFASLRLFVHTDWSRITEELSIVDTILRRDPTGFYARTDAVGRNRLCNEVAGLARRAGIPEWEVAETVLAHANAAPAGSRSALVGVWLLGEGRPRLEQALGLHPGRLVRVRRFVRRHVLWFHLGPIGLITLMMVVAGFPLIADLPPLRALLVTLALTIGATHLAVALVDTVVTRMARPQPMLRLDLSRGLADNCRTLVAVNCLLTSPAAVATLADTLELHYLGNRDDNLFLALLSDFDDAASRDMPQDAGVLAAALNAIETLNARYAGNGPPRFALFHRDRRWNPAANRWMGWERKRGKLIALNRFLRGQDDADCRLLAGDAGCLRRCAFVITLDADTALPPETGRRLAATLGHPMNRAVWDERAGRVGSGYGVLQPRISVRGTYEGATRLARLWGNEVGLDPYSGTVSDVYQDLYGEASYVGKGIYDIDIFARSTGECFPENLILSHDLLEGNFARTGLVSEITLREDYPESYATDLRRRHRWTRGDWQILFWLLPRVPGPDGRWRRNRLDAHKRWKILDNLRRSLVPVALLALLLHAWLFEARPNHWTAIVLVIVFGQPALTSLLEWVSRDARMARALHFRTSARAALRRFTQAALPLAMLPINAAFNLDAAARSLWRLFVSHRYLLEWQTAGAAARWAETSLNGFMRLLWPGPVLALVVFLLLLQDSTAFLVAAPFLLVWAVAPGLALMLSRVPAPRARILPDQADQRWLGGLARRHWHYFEVAVGARDHGLPCDNLQEIAVETPMKAALDDPAWKAVAGRRLLRTHRTSPTNIGLYLAATLTARDFGYLTEREMQARIGDTLDTLERLPRFRGHFYNWYDTQDLALLLPAYVSTVDSGNLLACLLVVARGLEEPLPAAATSARMWSGLRDGWQVLAEALTRAGDQHAIAAEPWAAIVSLLDQPPPCTAPAGVQGRHLARLARHLDRAQRLAAAGITLPAEAGRWLCRLQGQVRAWQASLSDGDGNAGQGEDATGQAARALGRRCRALAEMDFAFLWQTDQRLLSIGYDVTRGQRDASSYDLLASEARLTSFVAIAQGLLPCDHWLALGRPLVAGNGNPTLVSWGGSMFEYLMPQLLMPDIADSLMGQSCRNAVAIQIDHARRLDLPWGVSESACSRINDDGRYQYRSFGVPGLGFRRGLARDRVVAPYASALGLLLRPRAALANLRRLEDLGALTEMGFYEALDFTPGRAPGPKRFTMIRSHMAHHQGMVLLALSALLNDRPMQRRFAAEPMFRAYDLLLNEKVPVFLPVDSAHEVEGQSP